MILKRTDEQLSETFTGSNATAFGHMNMLMYAECDIQLSWCSQNLVIIK